MLEHKHETPARLDAGLGFSLCIALNSRGREPLTTNFLTTYSFRVNQVESAFIPFRSMLFPSHTAKAMGTDIPALN